MASGCSLQGIQDLHMHSGFFHHHLITNEAWTRAELSVLWPYLEVLESAVP